MTSARCRCQQPFLDLFQPFEMIFQYAARVLLQLFKHRIKASRKVCFCNSRKRTALSVFQMQGTAPVLPLVMSGEASYQDVVQPVTVQVIPQVDLVCVDADALALEP